MSDDILSPDPYIQAIFGKLAVHTAFNYVVQPTGQEQQAAIIGNTAFADRMSFGGSAQFPHTLVLCDVILRPRLVIGSSHLAGAGAAGILRNGIADAESWLKEGTVLLDQMPRMAAELANLRG